MSTASKLNRHLRGWRRGQAKPAPVIRTTLRQPTTAANLVRRFDAGRDVMDYFPAAGAKVVHPPRRRP